MSTAYAHAYRAADREFAQRTAAYFALPSEQKFNLLCDRAHAQASFFISFNDVVASPYFFMRTPAELFEELQRFEVPDPHTGYVPKYLAYMQSLMVDTDRNMYAAYVHAKPMAFPYHQENVWAKSMFMALARNKSLCTVAWVFRQWVNDDLLWNAWADEHEVDTTAHFRQLWLVLWRTFLVPSLCGYKRHGTIDYIYDIIRRQADRTNVAFSDMLPCTYMPVLIQKCEKQLGRNAYYSRNAWDIIAAIVACSTWSINEEDFSLLQPVAYYPDTWFDDVYKLESVTLHYSVMRALVNGDEVFLHFIYSHLGRNLLRDVQFIRAKWGSPASIVYAGSLALKKDFRRGSDLSIGYREGLAHQACFDRLRRFFNAHFDDELTSARAIAGFETYILRRSTSPYCLFRLGFGLGMLQCLVPSRTDEADLALRTFLRTYLRRIPPQHANALKREVETMMPLLREFMDVKHV